MLPRGAVSKQLSSCWSSPIRGSQRRRAQRPTPRRSLSLAAQRFVRVSDEVEDALARRRPVVALETTIYTHGYPYPKNLELSRRLESLVRQHGAVPATIGVLQGRAVVGLSAGELQQLVEQRGARKISRRDLAFALGSGVCGTPINGGTTIAGTLILASLTGIKVFATGGLGGVHRGGETSMDVSADLTELGRHRTSPVAVIASGCKGFLDIPRTLEYLETQGVAVATFADGRAGPVDFPAFWSRESGCTSPLTVNDEKEAAAMIYAQHQAGIDSSILFGNPVPEEDAIPVQDMKEIIEQALKMADDAGASGSANTPFVLEAIRKLSDSRSVAANSALVESNVVRGARVASELCAMERDQLGPSKLERSQITSFSSRSTSTASAEKPPPTPPASATTRKLIVAGAIALDTNADFQPPEFSQSAGAQTGTSNPCQISQSIGGVAFNIARAAQLCGADLRLCTAIGSDVAGQAVIAKLRDYGMDDSGVFADAANPEMRTAQYISFNDAKKDLVVAMADMRILESTSPAADKQWAQSLVIPESSAGARQRENWLALDANWSPPRLQKWIEDARLANRYVAFEPVSSAKAGRLFASPPPYAEQHLSDGVEGSFDGPPCYVDICTPNSLELTAMHDAASRAGLFERQDWWETIDALGISSSGARTELVTGTSAALVDQGIPQMALRLLPFVRCMLVKLGSRGVLMTYLLPPGDARLSGGGSAAAHILSRSGTGQRGVGGVYMRLFPSVERMGDGEIVSVNGAGDTFLGALLAGLTSGRGYRVEELVDYAQRASVMTLKSREAVSEALSSLEMPRPRS